MDHWKAIEATRKRFGLTRAEFASILGVSYAAYVSWKKERTPSRSVMIIVEAINRGPGLPTLFEIAARK